jgi:hypothetical protein
MTHKPNKTAKESFEEVWEHCASVDDKGQEELIWNWHISQLKELRGEIEVMKQEMPKAGVYREEHLDKAILARVSFNQALSDVLDLLSRFTK